jgi:hypothetical protein
VLHGAMVGFSSMVRWFHLQINLDTMAKLILTGSPITH